MFNELVWPGRNADPSSGNYWRIIPEQEESHEQENQDRGVCHMPKMWILLGKGKHQTGNNQVPQMQDQDKGWKNWKGCNMIQEFSIDEETMKYLEFLNMKYREVVHFLGEKDG